MLSRVTATATAHRPVTLFYPPLFHAFVVLFIDFYYYYILFLEPISPLSLFSIGNKVTNIIFLSYYVNLLQWLEISEKPIFDIEFYFNLLHI